MPLPPVIERLKQKVLPAELAGWLRRQFNWEHYFVAPRVAAFQELFYRLSIHLQESAIRLMQTPEDAPFWQGAPKSQAFEPVLDH